MASFFNRISHPALTDVRIEWGSMVVTDVYPAKLPDLFVGRPVVVTGKYLGAAGEITVSGMADTVSHSFGIGVDGTEAKNACLPKIWARLRIAELANRHALEWDPTGEIETAIRSTALEYQLMSAFTSFVAVDSSYRTEGTRGTTVQQAIPVPAGVRYETTVDPEKKR
jgi:Ca-activated chloride channel family protein